MFRAKDSSAVDGIVDAPFSNNIRGEGNRTSEAETANTGSPLAMLGAQAQSRTASEHAARLMSFWTEHEPSGHSESNKEAPEYLTTINPTECQAHHERTDITQVRLEQMNKFDDIFQGFGNDKELREKFAKYGLDGYGPDVLKAIGMKESGGDRNKKPEEAKGTDYDLGVMQVRPINKGNGIRAFDEPVARALNWDNSKALQYNLEHSAWKDPRANIHASVETLLIKVKSLQQNVKNWDKLSSEERLRLSICAYKEGQGNVLRDIKTGRAEDALNHEYVRHVIGNLDFVHCKEPVISK